MWDVVTIPIRSQRIRGNSAPTGRQHPLPIFEAPIASRESARPAQYQQLRTQPRQRVLGARSRGGTPAPPLLRHAQDLPIRRTRSGCDFRLDHAPPAASLAKVPDQLYPGTSTAGERRLLVMAWQGFSCQLPLRALRRSTSPIPTTMLPSPLRSIAASAQSPTSFLVWIVLPG